MLGGMTTRSPSPTDLSDREWALIHHLVPEAKPGGRPGTYPKREIRNSIFYLFRSEVFLAHAAS
jgi:transposase